jgi:hypothetical protein
MIPPDLLNEPYIFYYYTANVGELYSPKSKIFPVTKMSNFGGIFLDGVCGACYHDSKDQIREAATP